MSSGQVPAWVPIVVAVIGIVGVVSGQLVSAWRDDRRWEREREREDQRAQLDWEREKARWYRDQDSEQRSHWRTERLLAYTRYLEIMRAWQDILYTAVSDCLEGGSVASEDFEKMEKLEQEAESVMARIYIVGPTYLVDVCHEFLHDYQVARRRLASGAEVYPGEELPQDRVASWWDIVVDEIRNELGFDLDAEQAESRRRNRQARMPFQKAKPNRDDVSWGTTGDD